MKISPISASGMTVGAVAMDAPQQSTAQKVRALRMKTNVTPGRIEEAPPEEKLPIADANIDTKSAEPEVTAPLSPQLAAIARQRRLLQQEKQAFDREKAAAQTAPQAGWIDPATLKTGALKTLLDAGVTYEQLTEEILASQNAGPDVKALREEILKEVNQGVDQRLSAQEQKQVQGYLDKETNAAKLLVAQGDEYEVVRVRGLVKEVPRLIKAVWDKEGIALTAKEALDQLEEVAFEESLQQAQIGKVQAKIAPQPVPQPQQRQRQMTTLTNRDTAVPPMDAKKRALLAAMGQLKT